VRLSPLGTSGNIWPTVPAPDDRLWVWSSRWNENWQGKPKYSEKTCLSATFSTTNPTWPDLGSNPGRRGVKPATNRLSYGTATSGKLNKLDQQSLWNSTARKKQFLLIFANYVLHFCIPQWPGNSIGCEKLLTVDKRNRSIFNNVQRKGCRFH
jgi:hypothetical protein